MKRRDFLAAGAGSGLLGATPLLATAASPARPAPGLVVIRTAGLPAAAVLATAVDAALRQGGQSPAVVDVAEHDAAAAATQLGESAGRTLLGITTPAAAAIFTALARSHGIGLRWSAQHAIGERSVRHCCEPTGIAGALAWRVARNGWEEGLASFYCQLLNGDALRTPGSMLRPGPPAAASFDLASFILNA